MSDFMKRLEVEHDENWREIQNELANHPALNFESEWDVRIVPPFGGALSRFIVAHRGTSVSVYLDWEERLGHFGGQPYYEIYPAADGDVLRFGLDDVDTMMEAIRRSIEVYATEPDRIDALPPPVERYVHATPVWVQHEPNIIFDEEED